MKIIHTIIFFFSLASFYIPHATSSNDFCVANLLLPTTPSGYQCKSEDNVTVNDFVFSGFVAPKIEDPFKVGFTPAFVTQIPGLNGLGVSAVRADMDVNGTVPLHSHPDATELIINYEGEVTAGFITPNKVYLKVLKPGDVMVIPKGVLHFLVNTSGKKGTGFAFFSSSNPSVHLFDNLLFGNDLSSSIIAQTTLLDVEQIKKLKGQFGGSG
ncbi:auxin-binding protein ABP19b-like [Vicia villosa]|uniref:auxin-binding protein ABP19b-like n=1 Tax=Vicia villosa TaxID=3911 RepID=UPI00273BF8D0|nr:auxin-binding protein ABP19b-like [Vicia villosa]